MQGARVWIQGQGTKILHAAQYGKKKKKAICSVQLLAEPAVMGDETTGKAT